LSFRIFSQKFEGYFQVPGSLGISAGFIGAILSELKITPTGVGDIITYSRSIADYPSMYAAIFSIILLAVLFLNLLEQVELLLFEGNDRGYVSD
jgi:NitT/TauT family transport system permease protein